MAQTYKVVIYASTPWLLFGWIPVVCIITWFWAAGFTIIGVRDLHALSPLRAAVAVLVPVLIVFGMTAFTLFPALYSDPYASITMCYR